MTGINEALFNADVDGENFSAEDAAKLLENLDSGTAATAGQTETEEEGEGDKAAGAGENGSEADKGNGKANSEDDAAAKAASNAASDVDESKLNADNTVIMGKNGKYTIAYSKLEQERDANKNLRSQLEHANRELESLKAAAKAAPQSDQNQQTVENAEAAQQAIADGANPEIFGDFSEEALAKGIQTLVAQQVALQVESQVSKHLDPIREKEAVDASKSHFDAIYKAHPDANDVYQSLEFANWLKAQNPIVQNAYASTLTDGSASDVISVFNEFKKDTGTTTDGSNATAEKNPTAEELRMAALSKVDSAKKEPPASLSDIASGKPGAGATKDELLSTSSDGADILENMANWTPEQIEAYLIRTG